MGLATPDLPNWQGLPHPVHSNTGVEEVQWCKIFPLCTLHKEKVLLRQADLTGFHPQSQVGLG